MRLARLCKGSTADSDSVCEGSNPSLAATKLRSKGRSFFPFCRNKKPVTDVTGFLCFQNAAAGDFLLRELEGFSFLPPRIKNMSCLELQLTCSR